MMVKPYNRNRPIPGVSGRRIPGSGRMPAPRTVGRFKTNVPDQPHSFGERGSAVFRERHRQQVRARNGRFAGGWSFTWQGFDVVMDNIEDYGVNLAGNVPEVLGRIADEMVAWAKANAPWEDDSTLARQSLQAQVVNQGKGQWSIFFGHGKDVYYGIWLEVRWGGKYAIVLPTIYRFAPRIPELIRTMT